MTLDELIEDEKAKVNRRGKRHPLKAREDTTTILIRLTKEAKAKLDDLAMEKSCSLNVAVNALLRLR